MLCDRHRETLTGIAAGATPTAATEVHLASCPSCREELERLRGGLLLADRELAAHLEAEPSPALAVRVRRAASETPGSKWRWGLAWLAAGALAAAVVFLAGRGGLWTPPRASALPPGTTPASREPATPSKDHLPNRAALERAGSADAGSVRRKDASVPSTATRHVGRSARAVPTSEAVVEVLVPPGGTEALLRFTAQLQDRVVSPDSLLVRDLSASLTEPKAVDIQPLSIAPLDPTEPSGTD